MDPWALPDKVDVYYLTPTGDSWSLGDREITCVFGERGREGHPDRLAARRRDHARRHQVAFLKAIAAVDNVLYEEPEEYAEEDLAATGLGR